MQDYPKFECTWYAAHEWATRFNSYRLFFERLPGNPRHAKTWIWYAKLNNILTMEARDVKDVTPGSVVVFDVGPYGHVAIVEKVNADGTFNVSEYNYALPHEYGQRSNLTTDKVLGFIPAAPVFEDQEFQQAWDEMQRLKVFGPMTRPEQPVTCDRLAVFLQRFAKAYNLTPKA